MLGKTIGKLVEDANNNLECKPVRKCTKCVFLMVFSSVFTMNRFIVMHV